MKIACFADVHSYIFSDFNKVSSKTGSTRLDIIMNALDYIKDYCIGNDIKTVIFAGDLFHQRGKVATTVYNNTYDKIKAMSDLGIEVVMIVGNHDEEGNGEDPEHSLYTFQYLPNVYVHDTISVHTCVEKGGSIVRILCVPYSTNIQKMKDAIAVYTPEDPTILAAHLGVSGAVVGSDSYPMQDAFTIEDLHPDKFKYVALGHYHKPQFLGGLPHVFYCGSPIQHNFNDEGNNCGFFVVDTNKRWDAKFVPIPSPQFHTITYSNKDWNEELIQEYAKKGDFIRVNATEDELFQFDNGVALLDLTYKVILKKEFKAETRVDIKIGMSYSDIVTKYASEFNPEAKEIGLEILREVEGNK